MISWPSYKNWINEVDVRIGTAIRLWHDVEEVKGSCQDSAASCVNAHGFCLHEICQDCVFKPFYFRPEKQFSSSAGKKKLRGNPRLEQMTTQKAFDCILPGLDDSKSSKHRSTSIQSNDSRHSHRQYAGCPPSPQASKSRNRPVAVVSGDSPETMTWSITLLHKKCHDWKDMGSGHKAFPAIHSWLIWWFKRLCLWLLANFSTPQFLWFRQLWGVQYFGWSEISHIAVLTSAHWRYLDLDSKKSYQIHQFVLICIIYSNIVLEHLENLHTPLEDIREYKNGGIELRTVVIPSSLESWTPCHRSTSNLVNKKNGIEYEYDV